MSEVRIDSFLIVLAFMYLGVIRHYFNLKKTRRTTATLYAYLITGTKKQAAKHGAIFAGAIAVCISGIGDWVNPQLLWNSLIVNQVINLQALAVALTFIAAGYQADSESNNATQAK